MKITRWENERSREANKSNLLLMGTLGVILVVLVVVYLSVPRVPTQRSPEGLPLATIPTASITATRENLRLSPNGTKVGELVEGAELEVLEDRGAWVRVRLEGWIWKASTSLSGG